MHLYFREIRRLKGKLTMPTMTEPHPRFAVATLMRQQGYEVGDNVGIVLNSIDSENSLAIMIAQKPRGVIFKTYPPSRWIGTLYIEGNTWKIDIYGPLNKDRLMALATYLEECFKEKEISIVLTLSSSHEKQEHTSMVY